MAEDDRSDHRVREHVHRMLARLKTHLENKRRGTRAAPLSVPADEGKSEQHPPGRVRDPKRPS
jgi:hypothetical protein